MGKLSRAKIESVNDDHGLQQVQVTLGPEEVLDAVPRIQNYGFTSLPAPGAEAAVIDEVVIAVDDSRYRLKRLKRGEVAIYTDEGDFILLGRGNKARIKTKTLVVESAKVKFKNDTAELIATLSELLDALMRATVSRVPLLCPELPLIKIKIDSFKEVL